MKTSVPLALTTSPESTSCAEDSRARTSPAEARGKGSQGLALDSGTSTGESSPNSDRASSLWRTLQVDEGSGCPSCVATCTCLATEPVPSRFLPRTLAHPTVVNGSSSSRWPTCVTTDSRSAGRHTTVTGVMHSGTSLTDELRIWAFRHRLWDGTSKPRPTINPRFSEALMGFPEGWTDLSR